MWAGDAASGVIAAACDEGSQRTAPASSFSLFSEPATVTYIGVKAMIREGAGDDFTGHVGEPTQTILSI